MDFFKKHIRWVFAFAFTMLFVGSFQVLFSSPADFPAGSMINIPHGASVPEIAQQLADAHIIAHPVPFQLLLRASGRSTRVQAGAYLFNSPENLFTVAYRLAAGAYGIPPIRLTFPEGETARGAAARITQALPNISESEFLSVAQPYEGYLFPDTYLFSPSSDAEFIVRQMRANFNAKTVLLTDDIIASGHSLSEIVIMASLIEREARAVADRRMIAGILWNRLKLGMPLQVDAVFGYIFNRNTYPPSLADLKVDSPYNTYLHTGLPPGPIANPGIESLQAAISPAKTDYLYYLTGSDDLMHYATTYVAHKANRAKYLQ